LGSPLRGASTCENKSGDTLVETELDYGIAVCPEDGPVISDVVRIADMRMYKNKERRKAGLAR